MPDFLIPGSARVSRAGEGVLTFADLLGEHRLPASCQSGLDFWMRAFPDEEPI